MIVNPESTYNFRPTYYYNVWSVELDEAKAITAQLSRDGLIAR